MEKEAANAMSDDRNLFEDEQDEQEEQGSNGIAWFLTGVLVGATVAFLYAPKSGRDTRQYLADQTERGKEIVTDKTKDIADASRDMFERGRKVVEDAADLFDRARKLVRG
jgi:gas vesicle protein